MTAEALKAPFPYFGGKSKIAPQIWAALGDCANYIEPFAGSCAVLLARPADHARQCETINDADGFVANAWRAMKLRPEETAAAADWPVSEVDLTARHLWLVGQRERLTERLSSDPEWCDPKAAGWWIWGAACWIGSGWCSGEGPWRVGDDVVLAKIGNGVKRQRPHLSHTGAGVHRKLPHLGNAGKGVHRQLPHLGNAGTGVRGEWIASWFTALSERLRDVRVCAGDWRRVVTDAVLARRMFPTVGVFLDPPYLVEGSRTANLYAVDSSTIANDVTAWCREHGDDRSLRIVLAGYAGDADLPGWRCATWVASGGYGNTSNRRARANREREMLWLSPGCLSNDEPARVGSLL